jgi:hypothetical protein
MLACACALAGPATAFAQDPAAEVPGIATSEAQSVMTGPSAGVAAASDTPELWATVNICDTDRAPDSMGVRASMPGNGTEQRMYVRFSAQYWSRARQDWAPVAGTGVSPWVDAGSARHTRRQAGWTFSFAEPPAGVAFTMRAVVDFEWRDQGPESARHGGSKARKRAGRKSRHPRRRAGRRAGAKRMVVRRVKRSRGRPAKSGSRVLRSVSKTTQTGVKGVQGGDPAGTSKAMCLIY